MWKQALLYGKKIFFQKSFAKNVKICFRSPWTSMVGQSMKISTGKQLTNFFMAFL